MPEIVILLIYLKTSRGPEEQLMGNVPNVILIIPTSNSTPLKVSRLLACLSRWLYHATLNHATWQIDDNFSVIIDILAKKAT